jgi:prenyltransferase beta subunit
MSRALDAMLIESKGQYSGYLGTTMYAHGLGTVALSEAWGQSDRDDDIREALKAAVRIILGAQNQAGGWRYNPQPGGADVSVTAMQVVALASARQAGIFVPDHTIGKAVRYISLCRNAADGGFAYMPGPGVSGYARTAAASFSMMMLGQHDAQDVKDGVAYLRKELKANMTGGFFMYGMYYATLCFYQSGDADFRWWYPQIRDALLAAQQPDGSFRVEGRPYYDTPIALVILSVPYAYVPAYQR